MKIRMNCAYKTDKYGMLYAFKEYEVEQVDGLALSKKVLDHTGRTVATITGIEDNVEALENAEIEGLRQKVKKKKKALAFKQSKLTADLPQDEKDSLQRGLKIMRGQLEGLENELKEKEDALNG